MRKILRILIIDDRPEQADEARDEIVDFFENDSEIDVKIEINNNFDDGLNRLKNSDFDIAILDVMKDSDDGLIEDKEAGKSLYQKVKGAKFCPIIFYTALSADVKDQEMLPLVTVLSKMETEKLPDAIQDIVSSGVFDTRLRISEIENDVARIMREHMWTELAPHWDEYHQRIEESNGIVEVLITRLARALPEDVDNNFSSHASYRYIYPALPDRRFPGDILQLKSQPDDNGWWVLLTPACDLAHDGKSDFVLMAHALPLNKFEHFKSWTSSFGDKTPEGTNGKWNGLSSGILRSTLRYYYLPKFRDIPDLVIDLQHVSSVKWENYLEDYSTIASLASPFAESLLTQHSHYRGRIGVPDLDLDTIRRRLSQNEGSNISQ